MCFLSVQGSPERWVSTILAIVQEATTYSSTRISTRITSTCRSVMWRNNNLTLNMSELRWGAKSKNNQIPLSMCSKPCDFGHIRKKRDGAKYCWVCTKCDSQQYRLDEWTCQNCSQWNKPQREPHWLRRHRHRIPTLVISVGHCPRHALHHRYPQHGLRDRCLYLLQRHARHPRVGSRVDATSSWSGSSWPASRPSGSSPNLPPSPAASVASSSVSPSSSPTPRSSQRLTASTGYSTVASVRWKDRGTPVRGHSWWSALSWCQSKLLVSWCGWY